MGDSRPFRPAKNNPAFQTTQWSMVLDAARVRKANQKPNVADPKGQSATVARQALEDLCQTYWFPLYSFARRKGESPESAKDATQSFFADLIQSSWLEQADQNRGRFRSFLVTIFRRFLNDERKRKNALKRGGGVTVLSIDAANAEQRYRLEPSTDATAEDFFERRWAITLLQQVHSRLRSEFEEKDRSEQFEVLQKYLTTGQLESYAETAERLQMSTNNVKVAVHRMRKRYRQILQDEVAQTVESSAEVESELNALLSALSRR